MRDAPAASGPAEPGALQDNPERFASLPDAARPVSGGGYVIAVCGLDFEAAIAAGPGVMTLCGVGSDRLAARLEMLLVDEARAAHGSAGCRGIVSFGTAGGLDPALQPGACVIADEIVTPQGRLAVDAGWLTALLACLPDAIRGSLAGVDRPLADVSDKTRLWQGSGARAADMESHRAARLAQRHGLPFAACRVVVDPAHRSLPSSATAGLRDDGTTAILPILRALAAHPGQLPALIQLARDAGAAKRNLRQVRSRIGATFALPAAREKWTR
jgi:hopanoid-associated phosphorylase